MPTKIVKVGDLIELGSDMGLVKKSGSFYSYEDVRLGQGRENVKIFLKENPDVASKIENLVRAQAEATVQSGRADGAVASSRTD